MIRSLAIRRSFVMLDVVLAVLLALTAALILFRLPAEGVTKNNGAGSDALEAQKLLADIRTRGEYNPILHNGLFGEAGRWNPDAQPKEEEKVEPVPVETTVEETQLNLRLIGTIALSESDPMASAMIENQDTRDGAKSYRVGDAVMDKVTLLDVDAREVIIMNDLVSPGQRERLRMDEEEEGIHVASNTSGPGNDSSTWRTERVEISKQDMARELTTNYSDLVKLKPRLERDASGQVVGITADNIGQQPLAQKLGLQDGDVLQTVNNERVDSQAKIMELVQRYRNAGSFRISILRDGKPKVITYSLR